MYDMHDDYDDRYSRPATEAEAHVEWHLNSGIPIGTPGCPWDACHGGDDEPYSFCLACNTAHPYSELKCPNCGAEFAVADPQPAMPLPAFDPDDLPF